MLARTVPGHFQHNRAVSGQAAFGGNCLIAACSPSTQKLPFTCWCSAYRSQFFRGTRQPAFHEWHYQSERLVAPQSSHPADRSNSLRAISWIRDCRPNVLIQAMLRVGCAMTVVLLLAATLVPAGASFHCTPTAVWDGDGPIWCAEGPRIRLSGIAAREINGSCSSRHPCSAANAIASRDALVRLLGRPTGVGRQGHVLVEGAVLRCVSTGLAGGVRTAAWCTSPTAGDISCAMVRGGWAARWDRYWGWRTCQ